MIGTSVRKMKKFCRNSCVLISRNEVVGGNHHGAGTAGGAGCECSEFGDVLVLGEQVCVF